MRLETEFVVDGQKLTSYRLEAGMSIDEVARKVGCNKGNVSRWEQSKSIPTYCFIIQLILLYKRFDFVKRAPK